MEIQDSTCESKDIALEVLWVPGKDLSQFNWSEKVQLVNLILTWRTWDEPHLLKQKHQIILRWKLQALGLDYGFEFFEECVDQELFVLVRAD